MSFSQYDGSAWVSKIFGEAKEVELVYTVAKVVLAAAGGAVLFARTAGLSVIEADARAADTSELIPG